MMPFLNGLFSDKFSLSGDQQKRLVELQGRKQRLALLMHQSRSAANKDKQIDAVKLIEQSIDVDQQMNNIIRFNDTQLADQVVETFQYDKQYVSCFVDRAKKVSFIVLEECDEPEKVVGIIGSVLKNVLEVKLEVKKPENAKNANDSEARQVVISFPLSERTNMLNVLANAKEVPRFASSREAELC